ncbi:MAG: anti-sigma F factor [Cellulosilyticaceae bacterium]
MTRSNEMQIRFKSSSINEAFARVAVTSFLAQLDPTVEELYDIKMAVSEAVTNSIIHGYKSDENKIIEIMCRYEDKKAIIDIIDFGTGIEDIDEAMQPLHTSSPDDERAGLGFTVMQSMMDEVNVRSNVGQGTTVHLIKNFI